ncbi:proline-rich protein [Roridomyces roridus]|uniref:Proline-rich protein n=1 Tax=Roridomyces roridus TaxID=1738132 RepID=A0AAD7CAP0_9AGAR|nr:proline-rich protein [Roridomyces roridus]
MWTISGPFDIDLENNATETITTKLLKPGKEYAMGRKEPAPLVLKSKKVSTKQGEFIVDKFPVDDVVDPTTRPTLRFSNIGKGVPLHRAGEELSINSGSSTKLRDGDVLVIARNHLTVRWLPVCCYKEPAAKSQLLKACAGLGIHVVHTFHSEITHHITDTFEPAFSQAISLLQSAKFVTQKWLDEVLRLGDLPMLNDASLEKSFVELPDTAKYRPEFSPDLSTKHQKLATWEPNEARLKMFSKYRFILMAEGSRNINSELRNLITRGEGHPEAYDISGGPGKLNKAFTRGKAKTNQNVVLVADIEACEAAIGKSQWNEIIQSTEAFQLPIFSPEDILTSVLNADTSTLDSPGASASLDRAPSSSPLPDFVPNTHEEEDSIVPDEEKEPEPKPVKRLVRRTASRQASQEPETAPPAPPAKRHLTRRAQPTGQPIITGLDDASVLLNNLSMPPPDAVTPVEPKPRSKLKRRVGVPDTTVSESTSIFASVERDTGEEPPSKKFKALFDASHPARSGVDSFVQQSGAFNEEEMMAIGGMSQTQTETQGETQGQSGSRRVGKGSSGLGAVPEEEEESQMPGIEGPTVGQKRKERSFEGDDVEMADATTSDTGPAAKKRAMMGNAVERTAAGAPKPPSTTAKPTATTKALPATKSTTTAKKGAAAGAPTGKPDTDSAFLKAIASTKRGKKTEDDFDRDFNKLKISKSNLRAADEVEARPEWELLADFGDESNLRGNFMVIHEIEVFKVYGGAERRRAGDPKWEGKPDFKKFKRTTSSNSQKKAVELFVSDENDGGIGPGYWKNENTQNPDDDFEVKVETEPAAKKNAASKPAASRSKSQATTQSTQAMIIDESSDEEPVKRKAKRGAAAKPSSKTAEPAKKRTTRASSKTPAPLFLDDSDAEDNVAAANIIPEEDATMDDQFTSQTLQSSAESTAPTRRSTRARKAAPAPIIVDDDDDDVFGTRG